jgi:hypothetical protein
MSSGFALEKQNSAPIDPSFDPFKAAEAAKTDNR